MGKGWCVKGTWRRPALFVRRVDPRQPKGVQPRAMSDSAITLGRADLLAWEASAPTNYFTGDDALQGTLRCRVGDERLESIHGELAEVGARSAVELGPLAREVNREENLPRLERYDSLGTRTESVVFHPSYHEAGRINWAAGVLSGYAVPGHETEQLAKLYLLGHHGEYGHACPTACTAGLIKVLQAAGSDEDQARWLPGLLDPDYDTRLHASQFLTEVQGGSDVGANAVVAKRDGDRWRIHGEKWFCSVIDAGVFLMTARPEGAPPGTRGLGVFAVPRTLDDGRTNDFHVRRLKWKLGTKAMASAEADFLGAEAHQIGALDRGFKNVVEHVLDTSRIYNAIVCAGSMRRVYLDASRFAAHRRAFGQTIDRFGLVGEAIATLRAEAMAALSATLRLTAKGDAARLHGADDRATSARRIGVNINKYWTSVRNTQMVRLGIELLGGNGAIESFSVLPQLFRDAIVLESWEGTHNVLVQQVLRDAQRYQMHEAFVDELSESIARLSLSDDAPVIERVQAGLRATKSPLEALTDSGDQRLGRRVVDQLGLVHALVAMLEELDANPADQVRREAITWLARDLATSIPEPAALPAALLERS